MKSVLVVSKGLFHPTVMCRRELFKTIRDIDGTDVEFTNKFKALSGINPKGTDAVVLYFHEKNIEQSYIEDLSSFAEKGGLILCIHGALASFKAYPDFNKLTGSRFTGHGQIRKMLISGLSEFAITDEPYEFELSDDCCILSESDGLPVCWVKKTGKGTVVGIAPGHNLSTLKNLNFKNMIKYILNEY